MKYSPWFKVFLSGVGFWSDAYDLFIINIVGAILKQPHMYPHGPNGEPSYLPRDGNGTCVGPHALPAEACIPNHKFDGTTYIKTAALVGAVIGQLLFGSLADKLGRRVIFICTISMVILGAIASASWAGPDAGLNIYVHLTICRLVLGVGIGGEYPLSATVSSESSTTAGRGTAVSSVFAMQGWGNLTAGLMAWALLASGIDHHIAWRVCLGFTAVPGLTTVYWRYMMEETEAFKKAEAGTDAGAALLDDADADDGSLNALGDRDGAAVASRGGRASVAPARGKDPRDTGCLEHMRGMCATLYQFRTLLLGTAGAWFIFDVTFYANGLFSDTVFKLITPSASLTQVAADNLYAAMMGLPGYYLGVYFIDRMGRRTMQIFGFAAVGVIFLTMAGLLEPMEKGAVGLLVVLYGMTFLFANWGPNTTTYVIPSEVFPTRARATCHGISAASGKLGAVVGSYGIGAMEALGGKDANLGLRFVLVACGLISVSGAAWSMLFTPNMQGVSMDDIDAGAALGSGGAVRGAVDIDGEEDGADGDAGRGRGSLATY